MARKRQSPAAAQASPDLTALIAETVQAYLSKQQRSVSKADPGVAKSPTGWACVREDDPSKPGTVGFKFIKPNGSTKARKSLAPDNWALVREFWGYIEPQIAAFPLPPEK